MAKDVLIYGGMYEENAREFFECIAESTSEDPESEICFRVNTRGGNPEIGWGMINKIIETKNKRMVVDAAAYSMGFFTLCYVDDVEATDVSQYMVHRAGYGDWFEKSEYFTDGLKENLGNINAKLEQALRRKIDVEKFESLKGVKVKDIFSMDKRIDVFLNASEAKAIGLIKKIVPITPSKKAEIESLMVAAEAKNTPFKFEEPEGEKPEEKKLKSTDMTIEKLKAEFPAVYAAIILEGQKQGVESEKNRVAAWMAFGAIDAEASKKGIEDGKVVDTTVIAQMTAKALSADHLKKLAADAANTTVESGDNKDTKPDTEKEKELKAFSESALKLVKSNF